ncbi:response regulator [Microcoleus sp. FACHB-53]|jgi:DNA-binding response OmpR family regulator|nr:response regulator [Microcoleus sp. FACHB-53]MBD2127382.1 response regulator [Microcoleus sp. FACHB-1]
MNTALIVEDSLSEQEIISGCLLQGGLNVLKANNAEEAIARISHQKPDVIILDVVLPDRSGFELCRELKGKAETSQIPIVICSTKGGKLNQRWGMKHGADAYLVKPIDQEELVDTVKNLLKS